MANKINSSENGKNKDNIKTGTKLIKKKLASNKIVQKSPKLLQNDNKRAKHLQNGHKSEMNSSVATRKRKQQKDQGHSHLRVEEQVPTITTTTAEELSNITINSQNGISTEEAPLGDESINNKRKMKKKGKQLNAKENSVINEQINLLSVEVCTPSSQSTVPENLNTEVIDSNAPIESPSDPNTDDVLDKKKTSKATRTSKRNKISNNEKSDVPNTSNESKEGEAVKNFRKGNESPSENENSECKSPQKHLPTNNSYSGEKSGEKDDTKLKENKESEEKGNSINSLEDTSLSKNNEGLEVLMKEREFIKMGEDLKISNAIEESQGFNQRPKRKRSQNKLDNIPSNLGKKQKLTILPPENHENATFGESPSLDNHTIVGKTLQMSKANGKNLALDENEECNSKLATRAKSKSKCEPKLNEDDKSNLASCSKLPESPKKQSGKKSQQKTISSVETKETLLANSRSSKKQKAKGPIKSPPRKYQNSTTAKKESTSNKKNAKKVKPKVVASNGAVVYDGLKYVGCHVSSSGGVQNAVKDAVALGAKAFGLFLRNQQRWDAKPLDPKCIEEFKIKCKEHNFKPEFIIPHGSYLLNLGSPNEGTLKKSKELLIDEMKRCQQLGLTRYNFHPGSTLGVRTREECIQLIADGINLAHKETSEVMVVIENMSKQGHTIGGDFAELRQIIDLVEDKARIGICFDTCHAFAAGYDLSTVEGFEKTMNEFESIVGLKYLVAVHLNDSKGLLNSHADRHENIGRGFIGKAGFENIMKDPRFNSIPMILETPYLTNGIYEKEIDMLYDMVE